MLEFVHPDDHEAVRAAFSRSVRRAAQRTVVYRARHEDQHYVWLETTLKLMTSPEGEETSEILCISRNIADRKRMEERLYDLARTDHLTALPNRFLLEERFSGALAQARREGSLLAMLLIDIDRFKNINDTLGHGMGDSLLKLAASKLKSCIRECDTLARWGGDEFVLAAAGAAGRGHGRRDRAALPRGAEAAVLRRRRGPARLGVDRRSAYRWTRALDAEAMLRNADTAMYKAKARGGDCMVMYSSEMSAGARSRLSMENALFQAIERNELRLHYQPQISARTGRLAGVEALIRWQHPDQGLVLPGSSSRSPRRPDSSHAIGEWVLNAACMQMSVMVPARDFRASPVAVNLSSRQFRQQPLVGHDHGGARAQRARARAARGRAHRVAADGRRRAQQERARGGEGAGRVDRARRLRHRLLVARATSRDSSSTRSRSTARSPRSCQTSEVNASIVRATIGLRQGIAPADDRRGRGNARAGGLPRRSKAATCCRAICSRGRWRRTRS